MYVCAHSRGGAALATACTWRSDVNVLNSVIFLPQGGLQAWSRGWQACALRFGWEMSLALQLVVLFGNIMASLETAALLKEACHRRWPSRVYSPVQSMFSFLFLTTLGSCFPVSLPWRIVSLPGTKPKWTFSSLSCFQDTAMAEILKHTGSAFTHWARRSDLESTVIKQNKTIWLSCTEEQASI